MNNRSYIKWLESQIATECEAARTAEDVADQWRHNDRAEAFAEVLAHMETTLTINKRGNLIREIGQVAAKSNARCYGKSDKSGVWVAVVAV